VFELHGEEPATDPTGGLDYSAVEAELYTAVVGDVLDELGFEQQFLPPSIQPIQAQRTVAGRAMPVLLCEVFGRQSNPFGRLTEALDQLEEREIYVATGGSIPCAAWGEILTETAIARGAVASVVNAFHRDTDRVLKRPFPVFSLGAYGQDAAVRSQVVDFRIPIRIGQVQISPGDLIVGDNDGVVVVPQHVESQVLQAAFAKARAENRVLEAIRSGVSSREAYRQYGVL